MRWVPFERYEMVVPSTRDQVVKALRASTNTSTFRAALSMVNPLHRPEKPFHGKIEGDEFKIRRTIRYQNSWLPVITGKVLGRGTESRVAITFRLSHFVSAFMAVWMSFLFLFTVAMLSEPLTWHILIPVGLILAGYIGTQAAFWYEARKARWLLEEIFDDIG